ncbi:hypothetical protein [uncultured Microbacterium sp.]|uniref:Galactose oxidase n=1 Tax=uncultured Microbacterium sp. TaxID=191216 RepID=A0A1Y5NYH7_9MICO|nr:hypothetical protein [uncultured Microbacterium sp.]SBS71557.1 exported hypothetical protein [uncultured Microbacterium sp.]
MRPRFANAVASIGALMAAASLSACATLVPAASGTHWEQAADFPLDAREFATVAWTGSEVLVVGGSVGPPCPPNADCAFPDVTADGAAYDPATDTWHEIASAPFAFGMSSGAYAAGHLVVSAFDGAETRLLSYDLEADAWTQFDAPAAVTWHMPVADGDRILFVSGSDESGVVPDYAYDAAAGAWSELPDDPIGPAFDRMLTPTAAGVVLTAKELVPSPGSEVPSLTLAALLDAETGTWTRLPDTGQIGGWSWAVHGDRLIAPQLGGADGGEVNNWGRVYPYGGVITLPSGAWSALPDPPAPRESWLGDVSGGRYSVAAGHLYDDEARAWSPLDAPPGAAETVGAAVWAGDVLIAVGGTTWAGMDSRPSTDVWIYTPTG